MEAHCLFAKSAPTVLLPRLFRAHQRTLHTVRLSALPANVLLPLVFCSNLTELTLLKGTRPCVEAIASIVEACHALRTLHLECPFDFQERTSNPLETEALSRILRAGIMHVRCWVLERFVFLSVCGYP